MVKAKNIPDPQQMEQMTFLLFPLRTFQILSDEAAKRNLTLMQLIGQAVDAYIGSPVLTKED